MVRKLYPCPPIKIGVIEPEAKKSLRDWNAQSRSDFVAERPQTPVSTGGQMRRQEFGLVAANSVNVLLSRRIPPATEEVVRRNSSMMTLARVVRQTALFLTALVAVSSSVRAAVDPALAEKYKAPLYIVIN